MDNAICENVADIVVCDFHNHARDANKDKPNNLGKSSMVYPLKSKDDISKMFNQFDFHIKNAIENHDWNNEYIWRRNKLMFFLGLNIGVRGSDLCNFRWCDILDDKGNILSHLRIRPKKTTKKAVKHAENKIDNETFQSIFITETGGYHGKYVDIWLIEPIKQAIKEFMTIYSNFAMTDYIFQSRKGDNSQVTRQTLCRVVQKVAKECGITQKIGSHTLRKTFGYWRYKNAKNKTEALVNLQKLFNHDSTATTMTYIGITEEDLFAFYKETQIGIDDYNISTF